MFASKKEEFAYWQTFRVEVPRDPQDPSYVISFTHDQKKEIKEFFEKYGFIVVRDVLNSTECDATVNEIWDYIEKIDKKSSSKVDRSKPETWINKNWPGILDEGIIGSGSIFLPQLLRNRQNPAIHSVYSTLLGREDLLINHDRFGLFRPTMNFPKEGENHLDWSSEENLHLDMNPWRYVEDEDETTAKKVLDSLTYTRVQDFIIENNEVGVLKNFKLNIQGLVNLRDNKEADGGFQLVPGFHHRLVEFAEKSQELRNLFGRMENFIVIPDRFFDRKVAIRVTCRAGSLVLWDQRVLHGSKPNRSSLPRIAQFLKMFPADLSDSRFQARKAAVERKLGDISFTETTELGRKVFGLEKWTDHQA